MRRLLVGLSILAGLLVSGLAAAAAGGGFLGGAGETDSASAGAQSYFGDSGQYLVVTRSTFVFEPPDGAPYEQAATLLSIFGNLGYSCYRIPDNDFTISPDLSSALLKTTVSGPNNCGMAAFQANAAGTAGHIFSDGVALADPLQLDIEWANIGAVNTFTNNFTNNCLEFTAATDATGQHVSARAVGKIASASRFASAPRMLASSARLSTSHSHTSINSNFPFACT